MYTICLSQVLIPTNFILCFVTSLSKVNFNRLTEKPNSFKAENGRFKSLLHVLRHTKTLVDSRNSHYYTFSFCGELKSNCSSLSLIEYWHNSAVKSATETPNHLDCHVISGLNVPGRSCFVFLCELAVKLASLAVFRLSLARVCLFSLVFARVC